MNLDCHVQGPPRGGLPVRREWTIDVPSPFQPGSPFQPSTPFEEPFQLPAPEPEPLPVPEPARERPPEEVPA